MGISVEEQQLLQLLRGQDIPDFTLQISFKEKHPYPGRLGNRGWHLLNHPVWAVTVSVPHKLGDRTTRSETGFAEAWRQQNLWWRATQTTLRKPAKADHWDKADAERAARAETQFLGIVRGDAGGEFMISVSAKADHWLINVRVPGQAGQGTIGDGPSFAHAWYNDWPWWQTAPRSQ